MPQAQPPIPGTHRELWLTARPTGMPGPEHFGLVETAVPQPGQVVGEVVGEVVRAPGGGPWSVGDLVLHRSGFREEAVVAAEQAGRVDPGLLPGATWYLSSAVPAWRGVVKGTGACEGGHRVRQRGRRPHAACPPR